MAEVKVSSKFNSFLAKQGKAVEEAKAAENTMSTCAMPIGWKGQLIIVDAFADETKEQKDEKTGKVIEGRPYVRIEFSVVGDEDFLGKKTSKIWMFYDTEKATAVDRFTWFLNEMENYGLPREIRENHDSMEELLKEVCSLGIVYEGEVVANSYTRDGKEVKVRQQAKAVDDSTNVVPGMETSELVIGQDVRYIKKDWEVTEIMDEKIKIKSKETGQERIVKIADLD